MSTTIVKSNRYLIPRWRYFNDINKSKYVEFASLPSEYHSSTITSSFFKRILDEWDASPSFGKAVDLVSCGVCGKWIDEARPGAVYLLKFKGHLSPQLKEMVSYILNVDKNSINEPYSDYLNRVEKEKYSEERPFTYKFAENAISVSRSKLRNEPRNALAWLDVARGYTILGEEEKASSSVKNALYLAPYHRHIVRSAVRLYIHFDRPDDAYKLITDNPRTQFDPWILANELSVAKIINRGPKYFQHAKNMVNSHKYSPQHLTELFSAIGTIENESGNIRSARQNIIASLEMPTENTFAHAQWLNINMSNDELTSKLMEVSVDSLPHGYEGRTLLALKDKDWKSASENCRHWLMDEPYSIRPAIACSFIESTLHHNYDMAIKCAQVGLKAHPNDSFLLNNLSVLYAYSGNIEKAEYYFNKLEKIDQEKYKDYMYTATEGLLNFRKGNVDLGRQKYIESEKKSPENYKHRIRLHRAQEELNGLKNEKIEARENVIKYIVTNLEMNCHEDDEYSSRMQELLSKDFIDWIENKLTKEEYEIESHDVNWLPDALEQLECINQEAIEENYPEIDSKFITLAKKILKKLSNFPIDPEVYPTMDGELSIYFKSYKKPAAVLLRIVNDNCVVCHSSIDGENKEKIYSSISKIPDDFLEDRLQALL